MIKYIYPTKQLFYIIENEIYSDTITATDNQYFWFNDYVVNMNKPDREYYDSLESAKLALASKSVSLS